MNQQGSHALKPHARTLRNARQQIKAMVADGFSTQKIRAYIKRWTAWWAKTVSDWDKSEIIYWLVETCWDSQLAAIAASANYLTLLGTQRCCAVARAV